MNPLDQVLQVLRDADSAAYIGEPVSQLSHALQCAYFAQKSGGSDELILAALFHDLGHLIASHDAPRMADLGVMNHEHLGATYLRERGFSQTLCDLVASHVLGKRYLTWKSPEYRARLSEASLGTLSFQGGPMDDAEARAFEADPLFEQKVRLRRFDEAAKEIDLVVPGLDHYRPLIERHLENAR